MKNIILILLIFFTVTLYAEKKDFISSMPEFKHEKEDKDDKGHPLIHFNIEDRLAIDMIEARFRIPTDSFSILPRGFYGTVPYLNNPYRILPFTKGENAKSYIKLLSSFGVEYFYSNKNDNFIPGSSGRKLKKNSTTIFSQTGSIVLWDSLGLYCELNEQDADSISAVVDLRRIYAKLKIWKLSVMFGKDNIHLGPGEYGLLFSSNAEPFWMIKFQNEETLKLFGDWNFVFMKGWLNDDDRDVPNPEVMAMRLTYRAPGFFDFFELGMTRSMMYSGDGMYNYKFYEYPKLIIGAEDNVPRGKWDADSYGAIDFTFHLPFYKLDKRIKVFKLYFQEAGTDIRAIWQVEDWGTITVPYLLFGFYERAYLTGIFMALPDDIFRLEYSKTAFSFYRHHLYPQDGFTLKGMSIGHPLGSNHQALRFNHRHWFSDSYSLKWEIGYYQLPAYKRNDKDKKFSAFFPMFSLDDGLVRRGYITVWNDWIIYGHHLRAYFTLDAGPKTDDDRSPTKVVVNNSASFDFIMGLSINFKF